MAKATAIKAGKDINQTELLFEPKRDFNPYWSSSLFSDVYLKNDFPREYAHLWQEDENSGFSKFYQGFVNLCVDLEHESFKNWREADTVKNWIVPVMELLGWENNSERQQNSYIDNTSFTIEENGKKQVYRPDLIYFDRPEYKAHTQKEKDIYDKLREIRSKKTGAKVVVEAKYWDRLSALGDKVRKNQDAGDSASSLGPELQTLKYMELFHLDFGILTDGKSWKLLHSELSQGVPNRSYEFDLGPLMELALQLGSENNETKFSEYAKYFYFFFSKESFCETKDRNAHPLLYQILEYSKKYASRIEEDLKERFIASMGIICNSLKNISESIKLPYSLDSIRNVAESHLFNILFVKSCEVRNILPVKSPNYIKISLHEVIESLGEMEFDPEKNLDTFLKDFQYGSTFGGKKFDWEGFEVFDRFINLYEIIHDGTKSNKDFGFEIQGFKESIFSSEEWKFAKKAKINNKDMVSVLFNLNFIKSEFVQRKYQQIPYSYFTPRQLGSIYESFLEFRLEEASQDLIYHDRQWREANLDSRKVQSLNLSDDLIVRKGDLFFTPDNTDRKMSGSYYTPEYIVEKIITDTLEKKVSILSSNDILKLKICDPAMGSGHFLAGVLSYLTGIYRDKLSEETMDDLHESFAFSSRRVLQNCIYGADINPRAVKLAKMSLWLTTAETSSKLEDLSDQLICGDSLNHNKLNWKQEFKFLKSNGFDFILGNPPYVFTREKISDEDKAYFTANYKIKYYKVNLYQLFIERSLTLISEGGSLGFIVPNNWLTLETFADMRKFLLLQNSTIRILNAKEQVFENASVDTCILIVTKSSHNSLEYGEFRKNEWGEISNFSKDDFLSTESCVINPSGASGDTKKLLDQIMSTSVELDHLVDVKNGVQAYTVGEGTPILTKEMKDKRVYHSTTKKSKEWIKYVDGVDVKNFNLGWSGQFIKYGKNLSRPRTSDLFEGERLLVRQIPGPIPRCIMASYTDEDLVNDNNSMIIKVKEKSIDAWALLGILNSKLITFWFVHSTGKMQRKVFPQFKVNELKIFPIAKQESCNKDIFKELSVASKAYFRKNDPHQLEKIDEIVFKLYGISKSNSKLIIKNLDELTIVKKKNTKTAA